MNITINQPIKVYLQVGYDKRKQTGIFANVDFDAGDELFVRQNICEQNDKYLLCYTDGVKHGWFPKDAVDGVNKTEYAIGDIVIANITNSDNYFNSFMITSFAENSTSYRGMDLRTGNDGCRLYSSQVIEKIDCDKKLWQHYSNFLSDKEKMYGLCQEFFTHREGKLQ